MDWMSLLLPAKEPTGEAHALLKEFGLRLKQNNFMAKESIKARERKRENW